jgi:hypothetical protein
MKHLANIEANITQNLAEYIGKEKVLNSLCVLCLWDITYCLREQCNADVWEEDVLGDLKENKCKQLSVRTFMINYT